VCTGPHADSFYAVGLQRQISMGIHRQEAAAMAEMEIPVPLPEMEMPARHRPFCDADPQRASWDARSRSGPVPALGRLLTTSGRNSFSDANNGEGRAG